MKQLSSKEMKKIYNKLDKIQNWEEWNKLVEKYKNKAEAIEQKIIADIENWTQDKEVKYSEDDCIMQGIKALKEIKQDCENIKWLEVFLEDIEKIIRSWYNRIINSFVNSNWVPLSVKVYTNKEYLLRKSLEYKSINDRLTWCKNQYQEIKLEEIDNETY